VLTDEFWMGKAHTLLASSKQQSARERALDCREAGGWFQKALAGYEFYQAHPMSGYNGAQRIAEIRQESARCRILR